MRSGALACVLGDLDLLRPLGMAGIGCAVVAPPGSTPTHSRFCRAVIPWDGAEIDDRAELLTERLLRFAARQGEKPVLFYQEDDHLLFVSRHRARLADGFRFVLGDAALVEDLVDKGRFLVLAERLRLPVPATRRISPRPGAAPPAIDLPFPVIVKPLRRRSAWSAAGYAAKAVPVATPAEWQAWWPRWAAQGMDLLVQDLIPGPESRIESYHVYVDQDGGIAGEFTGRKLRTFPISCGHSTALTVTASADVAALGREVTAALGLRGVAKLDFKRAPDGRLFLLEVNPRFSLWHHLGAAAGLNLPAMVYRDLVGLPRQAPQPRARAGACWCRLAEDRKAAAASGVPFRAWLPWALRCEAKSVVWDDPAPILATAFRAATGLVRGRRRPAGKAPSPEGAATAG